MRNPFRDRADLIPALIGGLAFAGIPLAMLAAGATLDWLAWLSLGFGLLGIAAVVVQLAGWITPRQASGYRPTGGRRDKRASAPVHHKGPLPELSDSKKTQVRRAVRVMAEHGVFASETPDPALLFTGVAAQDWSVKPDAVLMALVEADYYHPGFDPAVCMANLVMHDSHAEYGPAEIERVVHDLARLAGDALVIEGLTVDQEIVDAAERKVRTRVSMTANGVPLTIEEAHDYKYLPLELHSAIARRMPPERRFAALWVDQGAFVTVLAPGAVEAMNTAFKLTPAGRCQWAWIGAEPAPPDGTVRS